MQRQSVDRKELARLVAATGAEVPQTALEPLAEYLEMLCQWNKAMNLVGPHTWKDMLARLVVDSFHLAAFLDKLDLPEAPCAGIWALALVCRLWKVKLFFLKNLETLTLFLFVWILRILMK